MNHYPAISNRLLKFFFENEVSRLLLTHSMKTLSRSSMYKTVAMLHTTAERECQALIGTMNPVGSKSELLYRLSFTCYAFDLKGIHKRSRYRRRAERHIFSVMIMLHEQFQRRQFFFFRQDPLPITLSYAIVQ